MQVLDCRKAPKVAIYTWKALYWLGSESQRVASDRTSCELLLLLKEALADCLPKESRHCRLLTGLPRS